MELEDFEKLVSQWLDHPQDAELRAAVERATAESPELERLRDEWVRLDQLVRGAAPGVDRVDWPRLQQRIGAELARDEDELDEHLRAATDVTQRVDWPRLRRRISQALDDTRDRRRVIRFPFRRVAAGLLLTGAAAAVVLMFTPRGGSPATGAGVARVRVSSPAATAQSGDRAAGFARVTVSPVPGEGESADQAESPRSGAGQPRLVEVFLMVEPVRVAASARGGLTPFGLN